MFSMESQTFLNGSFPCPGPVTGTFDMNLPQHLALGEAATEFELRPEQNNSTSFQLPTDYPLLSLEAPSVEALSIETLSDEALSIEALSVEALSVEALSLGAHSLEAPSLGAPSLSPSFEGLEPSNPIEPTFLESTYSSGDPSQAFKPFCSLCGVNIAVGYMCLDCQRAVLVVPEPEQPPPSNISMVDGLVQNDSVSSTSNIWEDVNTCPVQPDRGNSGQFENSWPYLPVNETVANMANLTPIRSRSQSRADLTRFSGIGGRPDMLIGIDFGTTMAGVPYSMTMSPATPATIDTWLPGIGNQFVDRDIPRAAQIEQLNELVLVGHENHVFDLNMEDARDRIPRRRRLTAEELELRKKKRGKVCERCKKGKRRVSISLLFLAAGINDSKQCNHVDDGCGSTCENCGHYHCTFCDFTRKDNLVEHLRNLRKPWGHSCAVGVERGPSCEFTRKNN
jgi:hypothetical protein